MPPTDETTIPTTATVDEIALPTEAEEIAPVVPATDAPAETPAADPVEVQA